MQYLCRLSQLTCLQIQAGLIELDSALLAGEAAWNLKELELENTSCANTEWMNALLQRIPQLTYLWLEHRPLEEYDPPFDIRWGLVTKLRCASQPISTSKKCEDPK